MDNYWPDYAVSSQAEMVISICGMIRYKTHINSISTIFNRYVALKIEEERDKRYLKILLELHSGINTSNQPMDIILEESILKNFRRIKGKLSAVKNR